MKKILTAITAIFALVLSAKSQAPQFGLTAGGTFSYYRTGVDGHSEASSMTPGFSAGAIVNFPLGKSFVFQPSLQFLQKGGQESNGGATLRMHINYLDLPLNFLYKAPGQNGNFEIGLGPCLSYGLGGSTHYEDGSIEDNGSVKFGSNELFQNAFEFSGNIVMGYQWKSGFLLQANYNMGFTNLWGGANADYGSYFRNSYAGVRFGYLFGKK